MVMVIEMVETHPTGILAHRKWGVTNAFMEGVHSVFRATKRKARGRCSTMHTITLLHSQWVELEVLPLGKILRIPAQPRAQKRWNGGAV